MKKRYSYSLLVLLFFLAACAKDGLWNQQVNVDKGRVKGLLINTDDESPLKGVKVLFERQTKASGTNTFVDTVSTDEKGEFLYELPFPNSLRMVIRDTGRYMADTARLEVLAKQDYEVQLESHPRFGTIQISTILLDEEENPMVDLSIDLFVRESSTDAYSKYESLKTDKDGRVVFEDIAFPVRYMVALGERPIAYEYVYQEGAALTKDDINITLRSKAKFGIGDFKLAVGDYYKAKPMAYGQFQLAIKSAIDDDFSDFKEVNLDEHGKLAMKDMVYPMDLKIKPTASGHPFHEINFQLGQTQINTEYAFEIKDAKPRYAKPNYNNLMVSTLAVSVNLVNPTGVTTDKKGNLYIGDGRGHKIVKVDRFGEASILVSGSGSVDGPLATASLNQPWGIIADKDDNLYFVDNAPVEKSHKVRKITFDEEGNGLITTVAGSGSAGGNDGVGTAAQFSRPAGLALDEVGNILYVSEWAGHRIRKIDLATNTVSTVVGTGKGANTEGKGTDAALFEPAVGIALSPDGKKLYVGCNASNSNTNSRLGFVDLETTEYKFYLGQNGNYAAGAPRGMFITSTGDMLYGANFSPKTIRKVDLNQTVGSVSFTIIAGNNSSGSVDGPALNAQFSSVLGICYDPYTGNWYIAEGDSSTARKIRVMRSADLD